ncbi:MAG: hypothetical protein EPN21_05530 [Methylococcaceae bacterium]|nr:MAG: hypothetical protein EPN21_05530 [Methylococcaceae bacterium]
MWEVNLLAAVRTIEKTMPMVVYRFLVSLAVGLACMLSVLAGAGIGFAAGSYGKNPGSIASIGAFIGFAACAWLIYSVRHSLLHAVRASHLLALVENREGRSLPPGRAQIDYAKQQITERFPQVSDLAQLDGDLRACLRALPSLTDDIAALLPIKHPYAVKAAQLLLGQMAASLGDVLLAVVLRGKDGNAWRTGLTAVDACAAQWSRLSKNVAWMYGFMYAGWLAAFLVIQAPVFSIAAALPMAAGIWPLIFALVLSWVLKAAFFEPIATAALMEYYFNQMDGQAADVNCQARLAQLDAYRDLQAKAGS